MARFRLIADEAREVSILPDGALRLIEPDELFDVPDEHAPSYECQPTLYSREDAVT